MRRTALLLCLLMVLTALAAAPAAAGPGPGAGLSGLGDLLDAEDVEAALEAAPDAGVLSHLEVVAEGLDTPRGMEFGPDGALYVAESGAGGEDCAIFEEEFEDEVFELEICVGPTGAVTRIDDDGQERVVTGLPSYLIADEEEGEEFAEVYGPKDVSRGPDGALYVPIGLFASEEDRDELAAQVGPLANNFATLARVVDDEVSYVADFAAHEAQFNPDADQPLSDLDSNPYADGFQEPPPLADNAVSRQCPVVIFL
jgi:hypothetical protein